MSTDLKSSANVNGRSRCVQRVVRPTKAMKLKAISDIRAWAGYLPGPSFAFYTPSVDDWEDNQPHSQLNDGCEVTHWAEIVSPNGEVSGGGTH